MIAQITINTGKRDPGRLEKWEQFLEGVELKALEGGKGLVGKREYSWHGMA